MKPKIERNSPAEESAIAAGIAADPENPEWTQADFAAARPADQVSAIARRRGSQKAPTKQQVALRLDREVIEALRAGGPKWQSRANELLRKAVLG